jgi:transcription initiation factor TFIIH subunit 3
VAAVSNTLASALCFIHRVRAAKANAGVRVLIVQRGSDCPAKYVQMMNCFFAAQKDRVTIDAISFQDSSYLQQGCDLTSGIYYRCNSHTLLLPVLCGAFLVDPSLRHRTAQLPSFLGPRVIADARAACFCHKRPCDLGYVCSVCLSIYCEFVPVCPTCQTKFQFAAFEEQPSIV